VYLPGIPRRIIGIFGYVFILSTFGTVWKFVLFHVGFLRQRKLAFLADKAIFVICFVAKIYDRFFTNSFQTVWTKN
jgi:hypothetical protein